MKFLNKAMDPMSCKTHFIGAIGSLIITVFLVIVSIQAKNASLTTFSVGVFGLSAVALYTASTVYHYYTGSIETNLTKIRLRKFDHAMIYVLIAGSYTPFILNFVEPGKNILFFVAIWLIAILGIIIKLFWLNAPRFISTAFYLLMGWAILVDVQAFMAIGSNGMVFLALGGVSYTIGALVYLFKKPNWLQAFGFHELFHIFVMIGSFFHFLTIYLFVI